MRFTINQALEMISRGENPEQYEKRIKRIKRLANERDDLQDAIDILREFGNCEKDFVRLHKKEKRLEKVNKMIEDLTNFTIRLKGIKHGNTINSRCIYQ